MSSDRVPKTLVSVRHFTTVRRVVVVALSIVQMVVPALVALADAEVAWRAGGVPQVHVEDQSRRACCPSHVDSCAFCRFLASLPLRHSSALVLPLVAGARPGTRTVSSQRPTSIVRGAQRTRAPPVG